MSILPICSYALARHCVAEGHDEAEGGEGVEDGLDLRPFGAFEGLGGAVEGPGFGGVAGDEVADSGDLGGRSLGQGMAAFGLACASFCSISMPAMVVCCSLFAPAGF
ncbi:MAG TPA: hypothetical protein VGQ65_08950 [Thermoanaerobaculia bacterium]|nr:hypothetical protein [Thermoanaerobaculia bacterium]